MTVANDREVEAVISVLERFEIYFVKLRNRQDSSNKGHMSHIYPIVGDTIYDPRSRSLDCKTALHAKYWV